MKKKAVLFELLEAVVIAVFLAIVIRYFIFQPRYIPTESMLPTLQVNDKIIVNKINYRISEPKRGDVVVFKYPLDPSIDYVKRLIGLPGETIEFRDSKLYINNKEVSELYLSPDIKTENFGPVTVPANFIFWPFNRIGIIK